MFGKVPEHKKTQLFYITETAQKFWKQTNSAVHRIPPQRLKTVQTTRHTAVLQVAVHAREAQLCSRKLSHYVLFPENKIMLVCHSKDVGLI
jgi:hypothetical protein